MKGAKIMLHAKSPTFRAAKLKRFTVFTEGQHSELLLITAGEKQ